MSLGRALPSVALAAAALLTVGCQNPFDPEADLRLIRWQANGGVVAQVTQSLAGGSEMQNAGLQETSMYIGNFSMVGAHMTSYVVVYRQIGAQDPPVSLPAGSAIPSLGGAAGRRFPIDFHVRGVMNNTGNTAEVYASAPQLQVRLITRELLTYISLNLGTLNGGIDCEVEVYGSDHNGHDVKVTGTLHVEVL